MAKWTYTAPKEGGIPFKNDDVLVVPCREKAVLVPLFGLQRCFVFELISNG